MNGGGGGGTTNVAQFTPPGYTQQGWSDYVNNATAITQQPFENYHGMEIMPINNTQVQGMQYLANLANNNAPDYATARAMNQITAAGGFENPYSTLQTENGINPYDGFSPEFENQINAGMGDITRAYQAGTAAQTDSAFNRAGAFHGGGHDAQIAANEAGLGRNLARYDSDMRQHQWDQSAGLQENALNRSLSAQQGDLGRASQYWDSERNRQMGSLQNAIAGNQNDLGMAQHLIGVGDMQRSYSQDMLNAQRNNYNQWQQYPFQMLDAYGAALSRASGNYGGNTQNSMQNYQANPFAALLGGGLLGGSLLNSWNS